MEGRAADLEVIERMPSLFACPTAAQPISPSSPDAPETAPKSNRHNRVVVPKCESFQKVSASVIPRIDDSAANPADAHACCPKCSQCPKLFPKESKPHSSYQDSEATGERNAERRNEKWKQRINSTKFRILQQARKQSRGSLQPQVIQHWGRENHGLGCSSTSPRLGRGEGRPRTQLAHL